MKQVIFICDLFYGDHIGGAELHDKVVYDRFEAEGFLFDKKRCSEITVDYVMENRDKLWFISNFVSLSEQAKAVLYSNCEYIIYEHDYKFLDCRNPINFPDFKAPEHHLINYNFYKKAKYVVCLCNRHKEIFNKNLTKLNNIVNIDCSMWTDEQLDLFTRIIKNREHKLESFAIIKSSNPIKKTLETESFCKKNSIPYELISSPDYEKFITTLANYKGLMFMTGHPEPTPRIAIEAKMLNIQFISQKELIGVAYENYFSLSGIEMIRKVREMREESLSKLIGWINEV